MKKYLILLFAIIFIIGCGRVTKEKTPLVKINNYEITKEEFEQEFKDSSFARTDTLASREEFLNNLINRIIILQDAEQKGLDKDKGFLKMVEKFWEQSLLKIALDKKSNEIGGSIFISDKAIEEAYNKMVAEGKADKPYDQMYNQIKWELSKDKESQVMNNWVSQMRRKVNIKINNNLIK